MIAETEPVSAGLAEVRDLQTTVFVLREELERPRPDTVEAVRQGVSGANAEIAQLKATITARLYVERCRHLAEHPPRRRVERRPGDGKQMSV